ncbi:MAG: hypothetical protein ACMUIG_06675 [Thermoplasmatota archaeon]
MGDEVSRLNDRISELVIGLYTDDFSLIHDMTMELNSRNVTLVPCPIGEEVRDGIDSLIIDSNISWNPHVSGNFQVVAAMDVPSATADRAVSAGMGRYRPGCLRIGIDPGARPGIAFIADGILIKTESASGIDDVGVIIERMIEAVEPERASIRIGGGDPENRDRIISSLDGISVPIEIVDERSTTRGNKFRDQNSAVRIARDPAVREEIKILKTDNTMKNDLCLEKI